MTQITALEERIAHLIRVVDDLSDEVARQNKDITRLKQQVAELVARELARGEDGAVTLGDERPPHW